MKNIFTLFTLAAGSLVFSQEIPADLSVAVKESGISAPVIQGYTGRKLSYYSDNYSKIFGHYTYTFDNYNYAERKINVSTMTAFYNGRYSPQIFNVMPLAGVNVNACQAQPSHALYDITKR